MNKTVIIVAIALVVVFAGIYLYSNNNGESNLSGETVQDIGSQTTSGEIKEFTMIAKQWNFEPNSITVNQGDLVKLSITSIDVAHGIAIPDYRIDKYLSPGQTVNIEFTADRKGTFPFACSVSCGVGHRGMTGKLIVN